MNAKMETIERAVEMAAKVGHLSRQSFRALLPNKADRTERLRWSELQASGYFSEVQVMNDFEFLTLSLAGALFARSIGYTPAPGSGRTMVLHDEAAARFSQWMFDNKLVKAWTPEIQLKKSKTATGLLFTQGRKQKFPDVLFDLEVPGPVVRFALEVELTLKSRRRYRDLLYAYTILRGIDSILFVVRNDAIANAIREMMAEIRFPEATITVLFTTASEVQKDPANALLKGGSRIWTMPTLVQWVADKRSRAA